MNGRNEGDFRQFGIFVLAAMLMTAQSAISAEAGHSVDLEGRWSFQLDPKDAGEKEQWFQRDLDGSLKLPGSLQEQGLGNEVTVETPWTGGIADRSWYTQQKYAKYREPGNIKVPFWLQPDRHYLGAAWYQRSVTIPDDWKAKRIVLSLERPHWETSVWVDAQHAGSCNSLSVAHEYDLSPLLTPGVHRLTIRIDNRVKIGVGINAHSVSDHTQSNWNGIVGRICLEAGEPIYIADIQIYPDLASRTAKADVTIGNATGKAFRGSLVLQASAGQREGRENLPARRIDANLDGKPQQSIRVDYPLGPNARLWDEFAPNVYRLEARLETGDTPKTLDVRQVSFGLREISTSGTEFRLNGQALSLRGTLECCIFPLHGYPPTDVASWKRLLGRVKEHGLNHVRFHSWCPPEAAFEAADELGVYYYVECASWANQGSSIGDGDPVDQWLYAEADRIRRAYGNHPSFVLMSYGNEPAGPGQGAKYLGPWVTRQREADPRRLYTGGAGWPMIPENQFHVTPDPRIHAWGEGLQDRINKRPPETRTDYRDYIAKHRVPVVSHEIGQWCVYPNLDEAAKYTGVLKPKNFEIFGELLQQNHMRDQAHDFLMASGKLQAICYKEEIESSLRTPGFGGFELLDLHDFPGQGTALVGVLDPFWDSKPYISPEEFRRFCGPTVPLVRMPKRLLAASDSLKADIEIYHYGGREYRDATVTWRIVSSQGSAVATGKLPATTLVAGRLTPVGSITESLKQFSAPQKLRLIVGIEGTPIENDWDLWVYPDEDPAPEPANVLVVSQLDDAAQNRLKEGGKVMWLLPPRLVRGDVALGFSPVFWNTAWTGNQPPHTLGILCRPEHPALAEFPTEYHTNWQWWDLISRSGAMVCDSLPPELRPAVQVIDTWFEARRLGLLVEARVGSGRLLVCSMDLSSDLDQRPAARQMRRSLFDYVSSEKFNPTIEASIDALRQLARTPSKMEQLGASARADSEQTGYAAAQVLDNDPGTIWHTAWDGPQTPFPHEIILELQKPATVSGLSCLPRQDMTNGRIGEYSILVSEDGKQWSAPVASGKWANDKERKTVRFAKPQNARFVKLVAHSEVLGRQWISAAEIELIFVY
jgi:hypothetical protein